MVPVDVRVIDKAGRPVTDLKQEDFTILEDGVRQQVRQFSAHALTPQTAQPGARPAPWELMSTLPRPDRRVFVVLLGCGRLDEPSKAIDALARFVRTQLLPQDHVAIVAYNRGIDFTTDHEAAATVIERFKRANGDIDLDVGLQMTNGMGAVYGSKVIPARLQASIDKMFQVPLEPPERRLSSWTGADELDAGTFAGIGLGDFVAHNGQTLRDMQNLYAVLEYLRRFGGDKHLLYLTEKGMYLPRVEDEDNLIALANDGRVAIHTFQTGGIYRPEPGKELIATWLQNFAANSLRRISERTGGVASITEIGQVAFDRLDDITRTGYLLGYCASNTRWDGNYRNITVQVNRPNVAVLFRHGYYRDQRERAFNRQIFLTGDRLIAAANFRREIKDIKLKLHASLQKREDGLDLAVDVKIDPARLAFTAADGLHVGAVDLAVFSIDDKGENVGSYFHQADLKLPDDLYGRSQREGITQSLRFPAPKGVKTIRVIVYDYKADVVGRADTEVFQEEQGSALPCSRLTACP
jgi:VWFA-related protein